MSKYTTQLRWWCEQQTGLPADNYAAVITAAAPLLFNFNYPIFDVAYKAELETKIIKHFYTREIGAETFGLFKLWLDESINIIMPVANKKYSAFKKDFDFLACYDFSETENMTNSATNSGETTSNNTTVTTDETTAQNQQTSSDTPQSTINNLKDGKYLSNAALASGTTALNSNSEQDGNIQTSLTAANSGQRIKTEKGRQGVSPSTLLIDYYNSLQNIDRYVFSELEPLFIQLW